MVSFTAIFHFFGSWFGTMEAIMVDLAFSLLYLLVAFVTYAALFWRHLKSRESAQRYEGELQGRSPLSAIQAFFKKGLVVLTADHSIYLLFRRCAGPGW